MTEAFRGTDELPDLVADLTGPGVVDDVQAARERLAEFGPGSPFQVLAQDDKARSGGLGRSDPARPGRSA